METPGDVTMVTEMLLGVMTSSKLWPGTWYQKDVLIVASIEPDLNWLQEHGTGGNSNSMSKIGQVYKDEMNLDVWFDSLFELGSFDLKS